MKSYSSREVIKILKANGWYLTATVGSHHHFKHPNIPGKVTVKHPAKTSREKHLQALHSSRGYGSRNPRTAIGQFDQRPNCEYMDYRRSNTL